MKNPILLLHGALGSREQFLPLQEILSSHRKVFTMDFEGHGKLESENIFSIELFTQNISDFLTENGISKIDIFGYSMGGYVALNFARKQPNLVDKIITLGTKFEWTPAFAEKEMQMLNPAKIEEKVPSFAARLKQLHGEQNWKRLVANTAEMMQHLGRDTTLKLDDLAEIKNRVLICLGELDVMSTEIESITVANALPNGKFHKIENLKHPIESAPVDKIASIINNFLIEKN
ncbi:alpha/beta hydrolase [Aequorivita sp. SDUM287046]|uniref:Alpha/beta hydrolase n=1 Tax=Aequorivita aurantiaca TaxID=3053356 RepID=A0ABT8DG19_9FLAO|nr:alpha/beta hydrolase [Aequorivita aurantiaca]MDN3723853.1 alpha/beta hydrolase [Aequorivita aurantiaca]